MISEYYRTLIYNTIFHLCSYFICLSIIYLIIIASIEKRALYSSIYNEIAPTISNYLKSTPGLCKKYIEYKHIIDNLNQPLLYDSQYHNTRLLIILISIIIGLSLLTYISFKYLNISKLPHLFLYLLDLFIIVVSIGGIEYMFFHLVASKYVSL
jgi:hypothetical protein